jgi:hypothetical protein
LALSQKQNASLDAKNQFISVEELGASRTVEWKSVLNWVVFGITDEFIDSLQ